MASEQLIPEVPVKAVVSWMPGDNTARIQQAIDYVSSLEPDAQGFRGAVLLEKGCYEIAGGLTISASGVVLRGSGYMDGQTELLGTGMDRTTMIRVAGKKDYQAGQNKEISSYVPPEQGPLWFKVIPSSPETAYVLHARVLRHG